eukprot:TRINITY_DN306_c2_g1_i2.p1 TRINITY_DN306_c2_g1~~TRINITY_DN306_c2_g1_i2.p1  ORF type:complete len:493 (+),score=158.99 TRINITY_DN306_c2_g1_i2:87-1481(+)
MEEKRRGSSGSIKTHARRSSANPLLSRKTKKVKDTNGSDIANNPTGGHVFGRQLDEVLKWQGKGSTVPFIVTETIAWMEQNNAANEEGIFRIPGQMVIINELKAKYDVEGTADLSEVHDVASVAGLLKLYLRELPEPLFVYRFYSTFVKIAKNSDTPSRLRNLRILLNGLPEANKSIIFYLLRFLSRVVEKEAINKMSSANLAMIFAPNLLRAQKEELSQIMLDAGYLNSVVRSLIEEVDYMEHKTEIPKSTLNEMEEVGTTLTAPTADVGLQSTTPHTTTTTTTTPDAQQQQPESEEDRQKREELEVVKRQLREKEELLQVLKTQLADEEPQHNDNDEEPHDDEQHTQQDGQPQQSEPQSKEAQSTAITSTPETEEEDDEQHKGGESDDEADGADSNAEEDNDHNTNSDDNDNDSELDLQHQEELSLQQQKQRQQEEEAEVLLSVTAAIDDDDDDEEDHQYSS